MHMLMLERHNNEVPVKESTVSNNNNDNDIETKPKPIRNFSLLPQTGMRTAMFPYDRRLIGAILQAIEDEETKQPLKLEEVVRSTLDEI